MKNTLKEFSYKQEQIGVSNLQVRHVNTGGVEITVKTHRPGFVNPVWGYLVLTKEESDVLVKHIKSNKYRKNPK